MRIAVAGLHTECSTYNPVLAREADFRVLRGPAMLKDAYFDFLTHFPAEFITILHARAIAGGPVERGIYDLAEVRRLLREHDEIVRSGAARENHMMFFWQLVNLNAWLDWVDALPRAA